MGKKVCHVTSTHGRYDPRIFIKQCQSLAKNGYDVTFLVNDDQDDETLEGVKIISTKYQPKNRIDRFLYSKRNLLDKAIAIDAEIYQLHDPDLLPLGKKLKKLGKKIVFDSHEDIPQQIKDKQWIPKVIRNTISKVYEIYEKHSVKRFDAVISVTPHIVVRLKRINLNTVMITNYPIINEDEIINKKPERAICFAGGITEDWNHHNILKAMEGIDDIKYILAGTATGYLDSLKEMTSWKSVEYMGKIPHSEVENIYLRSIAGMALNSSAQAKGQGTLGNTKLFEFMEAKLPVICTDYTLWKEIIDEYKCGISVSPGSVEQIKEAIEYIINNPAEAEQMGENGRKAVLEKFNWETQEKLLLRLYERIVNM